MTTTTKTTKQPPANPTAAFVGRVFSIRDALARLEQIAADHFGTDPDRIDWGHVGTLGHIDELIGQALEHAEQLNGTPAPPTSCGAVRAGGHESR